MSWTKKKRKYLKKIQIHDKETDHGIKYKVFKKTPESAKLGEEDKGKRVWHASYPRTKKIKLISVDKYLKIQFVGEVPIITIYKDEAILHPIEWTKERFKNE